MITLIRKELRISLDWLRPVLLVAFVAFALAPMVLPWIGQRVLERTWTAVDVFEDLAIAALVATPVIAAIAAFLHATGDDRHGAGTLVRVLPVPRWLAIAPRLLVALVLGLGAGVGLAVTAWALSSATHAFAGASGAWMGATDQRVEWVGWTLRIGLLALAAVWGSVALATRPMIGLVIGLVSGVLLVIVTGWLVLEVLDQRYDIRPEARTVSVTPVLPATALALALAGTVGMLGARRRTVWAIGGALGAIILLGAPLRAWIEFVHPAIANGWIRYPREEIESRSLWSFVARVGDPEPGYQNRAAWDAFVRKIDRLPVGAYADLTNNLLAIVEEEPLRAIAEARELTPFQAVAALEPLSTGQARVFERLEAVLAKEPLPRHWMSIVELLGRRGYLRPSAADAIEGAAARAPDAESRQRAMEFAASIRECIERFRREIGVATDPR